MCAMAGPNCNAGEFASCMAAMALCQGVCFISEGNFLTSLCMFCLSGQASVCQKCFHVPEDPAALSTSLVLNLLMTKLAPLLQPLLLFPT